MCDMVFSARRSKSNFRFVNSKTNGALEDESFGPQPLVYCCSSPITKSQLEWPRYCLFTLDTLHQISWTSTSSHFNESAAVAAFIHLYKEY